ncbi:hypothetical protein Ddc_13237 [Ditylenchus destructor]|nr:hypothetical protein Ddc_13237 [Ditylenchus destructor]
MFKRMRKALKRFKTSVANTTRPRSQQKDGTIPTTAKKNGAAVTPTSQKPFLATAVASSSTPETRTNGHGTDDSPPFPLPEMITEFKGELYQLHDAMQKDYEEMERLRHENESLRHQLAERDQMIQKLQQQVQVSDAKK